MVTATFWGFRKAIPWLVPICLLDNVRFHRTDWVRLRGAQALSASELDGELAVLLQWDREVLSDANC